jgi:hypothetical protein
VTGLNDTGQAIGWSRRFGPAAADLGRTAWRRDGTTSTTLGLDGAGYQSGLEHDSEPTHLAADGTSAGTTLAWAANGIALGRDAWRQADGPAVRIGLLGPLYATSTGQRAAVVHGIGHGGVVVGASTRIRLDFANGEDGWYHDPVTGITHRILEGVPASEHPVTGFAEAIVGHVTDDGFALGTWLHQPPGGTNTRRPFAFRPDYGFTPLDALAAGGLAAQGVATAPTVAAARSLRHVFLTGLATGQTGGVSAFVLALDPADAAGHAAFGAGCAGLTLTAAPAPTLGSSVTFTTGNVPTGALLAVQFVGFTGLDPGQSLAGLGAPGCLQSVDLALGATLVLPWPGPATFVLPVPNAAGFVGLELASQSAAFVPGLNALGLATSNGLRSAIGWY